MARKNERGALKLERKPSPNGRYALTLSFELNGEWIPTNYSNSAERLREWANSEIASGTFTGPLIEIKNEEVM